jgi:hypothetical protein
VNNGVRFVCRYLTETGNPKGIGTAEFEALQDAGLALVCLFEITALDALGGAPGGVDYGQQARGYRQALGIPVTRPIYFCVDFDPTETQWQFVEAYFRGIESAIPGTPIGVYGGYDTCKRLHEAGLVQYMFQTYAWSRGVWYPPAQLRQTENNVVFGNAVIDWCESTALDYGQWPDSEANMLSNVDCPAGDNVHHSFTCAGATKLRIPESWGDTVAIHQVVFIGDTPEGDGVAWDGGWDEPGGDPHNAWVFEPNRPGPVDVPAGATMVALRYTAAAPFVVGLSSV